MNNNKPKTVDISNFKYAMASELGENHTFLERLAEAGKIGKVSWNGNNYYEVDAAKKAARDMRTIPSGYVRAVDHAILLGSDSRTASELCSKTNAPAKKVLVNNTKPAWFVDKSWLEKQLGKTVKPAPAPAPVVGKGRTGGAPIARIQNDSQAVSAQIADLKATVETLRSTIQNLTRGRHTPDVVSVTEDVAREQGYRPLQELSEELQVSHSTLLGWKGRGQVRSYKVNGRVFVNVEDTERMYLKLDENRAAIARKMGDRTNNSLSRTRQNGVRS